MSEGPITRTTVREIVKQYEERMLTLHRSVERRIGALEACLRVEPVVNGDSILALCREHGFMRKPSELLAWLAEILASRA